MSTINNIETGFNFFLNGDDIVTDCIKCSTKHKMAYYAKAIEDHDTKFLNGHNNEMEHIDAMVMLASGDVCPVYPASMCCLNPFHVQDKANGGACVLSTMSVAGNVYCGGNLERGIENYNISVAESNFDFVKKHVIIACWKF